MSLSQALSTSLSGLRVTQAGLALIASNVANAQTPGYVRKTLAQETSAAGAASGGVRVTAVNREIDQYIQRQLNVEISGGSYAAVRADFYQRLQQAYGAPGSDSALETVFNKFADAVNTLTASPESPAARSIVTSAAQVLAQQLNSMTGDIQGMRGDTEAALASAVAKANEAIQKIADLNAQLAQSTSTTSAEAALMDQRDFYVSQLSELLDVRVVAGDHNQYNVFTNSGIQLVGAEASQLSFNPQGTVNATSLWDPDPTKSTLGTVTLVSPSGAAIDLIANKAIRSGTIAALIDLRDNVLVQAQTQLDALADAMARAMSSETIGSTAIAVGAQSGFDVDLSGLLAGNTINLTYTDVTTSQQHRVSIVRVDDPAALPLTNSATTDPNDEVIGVDFSGGMASVLAQLNSYFGGNIAFSNPSGTTLRVLDDGAPNLTDIDGLSITRTATSLSGGAPTFAFFTDATGPYSAAITSSGPQSCGFAGRISVNPALLADPSRLVLYGSGVAAGDAARPNFILQQLTSAQFSFSPITGFGSTLVPYASDLPPYLRQVLSQQGEAADNAASLSRGQDVVVNALKQRAAEQSGVNVDQEMANLLSLQTAYAANARVMSTVKDMLDVLMKI